VDVVIMTPVLPTMVLGDVVVVTFVPLLLGTSACAWIHRADAVTGGVVALTPRKIALNICELTS
jgi:hypothetical protein